MAAKWVESLSECLGLPLTAVEGSKHGNHESNSLTARGAMRVGPGLELSVLAEIYLAEQQVWAMLFVYLNGKRVGPSGFDYLILRSNDGVWQSGAWERDEYQEWAKYDSLPTDS